MLALLFYVVKRYTASVPAGAVAKTQSEQLKGGQHVAQEAPRQGHDGSRKQVSNNNNTR